MPAPNAIYEDPMHEIDGPAHSKYVNSQNDLGIVAVGFAGGQQKIGVEAAPNSLVEAGLLEQLETDLGYNLHWDGKIHDYVDVMPTSDPMVDNMLQPLGVSAVTKKLAQQVYQHAKDGRLTLTLGGDHSIAIGSVYGAAKAIRERTGKSMALIWVDAHADINTPETTDSGNIHGMPVAFLTGIAKHPIFDWCETTPNKEFTTGHIDTNRIVYIGLRDVDRGEKMILRKHKIKAFSMHDVDRHGIGKVVDMALDHLRDDKGDTGPIYLSFDVDALDPSIAPSTGTPVRGGLTLREGDFICECVHETGCLVGMDLVEVNPILEAGSPGAQETLRAGCSLVRCAFGESLL